MDAKLLLQRNTTIHSFCKFMGRQKTSSSSSDFMTRSSDSHKVHKLSNNLTVYNDNWFDRLAISHLSHAIQAITGIKSKRKGYDGLLEACRALSQDLNAVQQREVAIEILRKAFPTQIIFLIRIMVTRLDFSGEMFAAFTTLFFAWLLGPSEVKESKGERKKKKNTVYVKRCRFLEGSNCAGMCINLCKFPSQAFIKDSLGVPVSMLPNFEDMSCEIIFGEEPPQPNEDPASKQPCYKLCKMNTKKRHGLCAEGSTDYGYLKP